MTDKKKALGDKMRDLINPALEDSQRPKTQAEILDMFFSELVYSIPDTLEKRLSAVFQAASSKSAKSPEIVILTALTTRGFPILSIPLPMSTAFTDYTVDDVLALPNYIRLHQMAREENIALKIIGLLADEGGSMKGLSPPIVIVDSSKTYEEGALENPRLYPNLPPPVVKFNPGAARGDFTF